MIVTISLRAESDIFDIGAHVARENPQAAKRLIDALFDACAELAPFPERFAIAAEVGRPDVRRCLVGDYLIFYVARREDVFVLRVTHGARDLAALFGEPPPT